jgi:anaerobic dimethyl sulfoxide reductase subunit C
MDNNDWSLIFFTLLAQFSVGLIIFLTGVYFYQYQAYRQLSEGLVFRSPQFLGLVAIVAATVVSFLHLGFPGHAFNAANNILSSWLSREILGIGLFGLAVLAVFLLHWLVPDHRLFQTLVLIFGSFVGLLLLYFMSRIYLIPVVPAWNTWFTPFHFFLSSFILGGLVISGYLMFQPGNSGLAQWMFRGISFMLLLQLVAAFLYKSRLVNMEHTGIAPPDFETGFYHTFWLIRLLVLFVVMIFTCYLSFRVHSVEVNYNAILRFYSFIFLLAVAEETIGRMLFYAGFYRVGV